MDSSGAPAPETPHLALVLFLNGLFREFGRSL
jgi:hypothetical protein